MVSLGLFNWTTDLSDEPEYPPIFDDLWAADSGRIEFSEEALTHLPPRCLVLVMTSYGRKGESRIGMMEFIGGPSYESIVESYGKEEWKELEEYHNSLMGVPMGAHREGSFMQMILNEPVFIMFDFPDRVLPLTSEDSKFNFYHWESYDWWICINQEWNTQVAKILERNSPEVMKEFADCRVGRRLRGMTVGELKGLLKEAGKSVSGKKEDLVKRLIDNNPFSESQ